MDNQFIEYLKSVIPAVILGTFGAFVSIISGDKKIELRYFFGTILLAVFVVAILDAGLKEMGLKSMNVWVITSYMGGYCSRKVVEIIENRFISTLKVKSGMSDAKSKKED